MLSNKHTYSDPNDNDGCNEQELHPAVPTSLGGTDNVGLLILRLTNIIMATISFSVMSNVPFIYKAEFDPDYLVEVLFIRS